MSFLFLKKNCKKGVTSEVCVSFSCHLCPHRASSAGQISRHVKTVHLNERPFACPDEGCTFTASNRYAVRIHAESVHLKRRDVACPHCNYRAATTGIMNGHIRRRHGGVGMLKGKTRYNFQEALERDLAEYASGNNQSEQGPSSGMPTPVPTPDLQQGPSGPMQ